MSLKVTFHNPAFPKDQEFDLAGVLVKNGHAVTLTDEQEAEMAQRVGMPIKEYVKGSADLKVEGTATVSAKDIEGGE